MKFIRSLGIQTSKVHHKGLLLLISLMITACSTSSESTWADVQIGTERSIELDVDENTILTFKLPPGDVSVDYVAGSELSGTMVLYCPSLGSRCENSLGDLEFLISRDGNRVSVSSNKSFRNFAGNRKIVTRLKIPAVKSMTVSIPAGDVDINNIVAERLNVDLKAGDMDVLDIQACLKVDQGAGDVSIRMPADLVSSVQLDARVGDVSLRERGDYHSGKRAWLVGAELDWRSGHRGCNLEVNLQAGEVKVTLND